MRGLSRRARRIMLWLYSYAYMETIEVAARDAGYLRDHRGVIWYWLFGSEDVVLATLKDLESKGLVCCKPYEGERRTRAGEPIFRWMLTEEGALLKQQLRSQKDLPWYRRIFASA